MNYAVSARIPLVEGLVVNTNGGIIDTHTEVANSLHPLLGVFMARAIVLKIWDSAVGGTPKGIASLVWAWRVNGGTTGWTESATPYQSGGGFITNAQAAYAGGVRAAATIILTPVCWGAAAVVSDAIPVDDISFRFTTDATTNSGTFNVDAYVMRHIG